MLNRKVLAICEPPTVNSGFGVVAKQIIPEIAKHFDLTLFATGAYGQPCAAGLKELGIDKVCVVPDTFKGRELGVEILDGLLSQVDPGAVFSYYDIGSVMEYVKQTSLPFYPHVSYLISEGEPMMRTWTRLFKDNEFQHFNSRKNYAIEEIILPSDYANEVAMNQTGRECLVAHHGVDHAKFTQYPETYRKELRSILSSHLNDNLDDAFIFLYVARNAGRKQWPRLFLALKLLKERLKVEGNSKRVVLFGQTKIFTDFKHGGWHLSELAEDLGLAGDDVFFGNAEDIGGTPFETDGSENTMIKLYNLADAYVHPSSMEGCGLPLLEAAKCGLPVLTTKYAGGWDYAKDFALPIEVETFDYHSTGTKHGLVSIKDLSDQMYRLVTNPALRHEYSNKSLKNCNYSWQGLRDTVLSAIERALVLRK